MDKTKRTEKKEVKQKVHNVIIIGGGPAGLTAALYTARANLSPLVIEGSRAGGQLMLTTEVENFPGFEKGIMGPELIEIIHKQAERFGAEFISDDVVKVDFSARPFKIFSAEKTLLAKAVIVSTGASTKWLGLESEQKLIGKGVSSCATCDAYFFKDKEVVIIGGGDSALEESLFLTKFASKVTIIHRRDELRASKIMQDRAKKNSKISFIWDTSVEEIKNVTAGKVSAVVLKNLKTNKTTELKCDGIFVAIGHEPNTKLFRNILTLDQKGYITTEPRSTYTNIKGVFACGDVQDHVYKQAITAAGTGCMAAIDAERFLESEGH
ncbi:thioredoxin-disulfide reductase [Candidatus Woesearchaeota archaeon]|nr:thioredoxin-disulfide reductase [Candidatus Woesearchaeota archaeon]